MNPKHAILLITSICFIVLGCGYSGKSTASQTTNDELPIVRSYHPKEKIEQTKDTLIHESWVLSVRSKALGTYVTQEFEDEEEIRAYHYRNFSYKVTLKRENEAMLDTVLYKEAFKSLLDPAFLDSAIFRNYSFERYDLKARQLYFFGIITKPDTDWTWAFYHIYSLESNDFVIEEYENGEM